MVKGERPDRAAEHKKKTMKTNKQNKSEKAKANTDGNTNFVSGLPIRPEQSSTATAAAAAETAPTAQPKRDTAPRPYVNFEEREKNRQLPVERVLAILKRWNPRQYELAEVVGKWVWITFAEQPDERVRADLSQLGFHWNNTRKCWQHPCGQVTTRGQQNPRDKYTSYFPADQAAA